MPIDEGRWALNYFAHSKLISRERPNEINYVFIAIGENKQSHNTDKNVALMIRFEAADFILSKCLIDMYEWSKTIKSVKKVK